MTVVPMLNLNPPKHLNLLMLAIGDVMNQTTKQNCNR